MKWIVVISLLLWMFDVATVLACGICMFNQFDYFLPPIHFWCMWSVSWFLSMAILSTNTGQHFTFQPSAPIALVIVFFAYKLLFSVL
jgi:hypothetical protein